MAAATKAGPAAPAVDSNGSFAQRSELVLSLSLLGILVVLLVPLPTLLLDFLLALNLALTILLLLVTLSAKQALDFSVFPSLLLLLTLVRLALNVATTRLILLGGSAGAVVSAFGGFVVGGNLVVGLVVFLILVIIQFVVITKGAGRVSEVSARFTLDAMPGKQVAIDAELNSGAIDDVEARRRRQHLLREAEFYGAMDGASKFVRGDAVAGLVITAINLVGGFILGLTRHMSLAQSFQTYAILSVGDGLISQVPALIVATASGILVTKATTQTSLGAEISAQVALNPRPILVGSVIMLGLALAPGLPHVPFLGLAALLYYAARRLAARPAPAPADQPAAGPAAAGPGAAAAAPHFDDFLQTDRAAVEIGARLIPLVSPKRGNGLLDRIAGLRRDLARKNGVWVPPVRVRDNIHLEADAYRILVGGREVARGQVRPDRMLAIDPGGARLTFPGEAAKDPAFGLPARWIAEGDRARAEMGGFTVVDAPTVLITHLGEVVRKHAHELFSREDLKLLVDKVRESAPSVVDELIPNVLTMGSLHRVLCLLLEEHVPISNLPRLLEALAHHALQTKDPAELAERIRPEMGRVLCDRFRDEQGRLHAIVFDPRVEAELRRSLADKVLALDAGRLEKLIARLLAEWRKAAARNQEAALLTDAPLRRPLRHALARSLPDLAVLAYGEVPADLLLEPAAMVRPEDLAPPAGRPA
jgi:flagellar biosynthesis protein FlhA